MIHDELIHPRDAERHFLDLTQNDPVAYSVQSKIHLYPELKEEYLMIGMVILSRRLNNLQERHQALLSEVTK